MTNSLIKLPNTENAICEYCGQALEENPYSLVNRQDRIKNYSYCDCDKVRTIIKEHIAKNEEVQTIQWRISLIEHDIEAEKTKAERLIKESNLGRRFQERTFGSFDQKKNPAAFNKSQTYAEGFESNNGQGLLFLGTPGTGKTHLAAAITNYIITEFGVAVKFGNFVDILEEIKSKFKEVSDYNIIEQLLEVPLLVIDDIGKERSSEWSNSILYRVINSRYEDYKPTIITTNDSIEELESSIGEAVVSRIIEMCDGIKMNGEDYRKAKLK